jgi:hypothetical protein
MSNGLVTTVVSLVLRAASGVANWPLLKEFRFDAGLADRSWDPLLFKLALLCAAGVGLAALRRRPPPWRPILRVAAALLSLNILLDFGRVTLSYNHPGLFGSSFAAPLFAHVEPAFAWPVLVHVAVIGCLLAFGLPWISSPRCRPAFFAAVVFGAALIGPISLGLSSPWKQVLHQPFFSGLDYVQHTRSLADTPALLRDYVEAMPDLSVHARAHGPGPLLGLSALRAVLGDSALRLALGLQAIAALLPLLTWLVARRFLEEGCARLAALLLLLTPSFHLFSFVSMEGVFAVLLFASAGLLLACLFSASSPWLALLLGAMAYVSTFWTFSSAFLGPFALFTGGLAIYWGLIAPRHTGVVVIWAALAFGAADLALRGLGFDLLACFEQARQLNASMMGSAWRSSGHYLLNLTGTLGAFAFGCGIPVTAMWLAALRHHRRDRSAASCVAWGASATILLLALMGLYQWEVERIWLFLTPLVCLPAARYLHEISDGQPRRLGPVLGLLWLQTVLSELFLDTHW